MLPSLTTISISFHMTPLYSSTGTDKWTRKINKFKKKEKKKKKHFPHNAFYEHWDVQNIRVSLLSLSLPFALPPSLRAILLQRVCILHCESSWTWPSCTSSTEFGYMQLAWLICFSSPSAQRGMHEGISTKPRSLPRAACSRECGSSCCRWQERPKLDGQHIWKVLRDIFCKYMPLAKEREIDRLKKKSNRKTEKKK